MEPTHIILSNVHALASYGESNVNTIVDNKGHTVLLADSMKYLGNLYLLPCICLLLAILHNGDSSLTGRFNNLEDIIGTENSRCLVGDQVKRIIHSWLHDSGELSSRGVVVSLLECCQCKLRGPGIHRLAQAKL